MQSKIPLYPYNAKTAQERGEIEKWRESFRENCACAGGIDILIRENFDGMHLKDGTVWIAMLLCAAGSISIACLPFLVRSLPCRFGLYNRERT